MAGDNEPDISVPIVDGMEVKSTGWKTEDGDDIVYSVFNNVGEEQQCVCCAEGFYDIHPDPWEGRMSDYCVECRIMRCDTSNTMAIPFSERHPGKKR